MTVDIGNGESFKRDRQLHDAACLSGKTLGEQSHTMHGFVNGVYLAYSYQEHQQPLSYINSLDS